MKRFKWSRVTALSAALTLALGSGAAFAAQTDSAAPEIVWQPDAAAAYTPEGASADDGGKHSGYKHKMIARSGSLYEQAAKTLGMDKEALMQELKSGKSLADIAKSKRVKESDLKAALLKEQTARIDKAQKNGKVSAEKAASIKGKMSDFVDKFISRKGLAENRHADMMFPARENLAKRLGLTEDELRDKLKSGKSIAEIAKEKGISRDELVRGIKEDMTPFIDRMIEHKRTADKEMN